MYNILVLINYNYNFLGVFTMGKIKQTKNISTHESNDKHNRRSLPSNKTRNNDFFWSMSMAPRLEESMHWFQMLPAAFFTACVIIIVRMHSYTRPMSQFYWTNSGNDSIDFFSYFKMVAITLCAVIALLILLYRVFSQSMFIKRSPYYIPMIIYSVLVLLSYFMSDYKEFALLGWNDRFEGTITLLAYMVMLFYIINTINNEKDVKTIIYSLGVISILLSLLGLTQALGHDFFRTTIGKKLITPSSFWPNIDQLTFTFTHNEIYQTVYNINYVSFYLTLLLPLFGLLFIHSVMNGKEEPIWKKIAWGGIFALLLYNLIGSQSSGGFLGMGIVVLVALIVLNKSIIKWWRPVVVLLVITLLVGGLTYARWMPEITGASRSVLGITSQDSTSNVPGTPAKNELKENETATKGYIDYIETKGNDIIFSYEGNQITFTTYPENPLAIKLTDGDGKDINIKNITGSQLFTISDKRFSAFVIGPAQDSAGTNYFMIKIDGSEWDFAIVSGHEVRYRNALGNLVSLSKVPAIGWADNQDFGSGRGYIWSRTVPMLKYTLILGHGADTYCIYFPQNDYVGKYNANWESTLIVDKPHNMYFGAIVGTGMLSMIALIILWLTYIIQSIKLYWKRALNSFTEYTGVGIFLGICGFLVSAFVDDSTVSVMPMFYGLLGIGIAINIMLKKQTKEASAN